MQVALFPVGTKVTNTGTKENGDPVLISAAGASEITVSTPGEAFVEVRDPRPCARLPAPARRSRNAGCWWI